MFWSGFEKKVEQKTDLKKLTDFDLANACWDLFPCCTFFICFILLVPCSVFPNILIFYSCSQCFLNWMDIFCLIKPTVEGIIVLVDLFLTIHVL